MEFKMKRETYGGYKRHRRTLLFSNEASFYQIPRILFA